MLRAGIRDVRNRHLARFDICRDVTGATADIDLLHPDADDLLVLLRKRLGGITKDIRSHSYALKRVIGGGVS